MTGLPRMLIFWDADGNARWSLDYMVALDENRQVVGLIDFEAHELKGGRMRDIADKSQAVGAGTWPEWIDPKGFRVELDPSPAPARAKIARLVHKQSGHKRERAAIEAAIEERVDAKKADAKKRGDEQRAMLKRRKVPAEMVAEFSDPPPEPTDLRDLLGGPNRPLLLDEDGRTRERPKVKRPALPVVGRSKG